MSCAEYTETVKVELPAALLKAANFEGGVLGQQASRLRHWKSAAGKRCQRAARLSMAGRLWLHSWNSSPGTVSRLCAAATKNLKRAVARPGDLKRDRFSFGTRQVQAPHPPRRTRQGSELQFFSERSEDFQDEDDAVVVVRAAAGVAVHVGKDGFDNLLGGA
jgi:hypothetical protein